LGIDLQLNVRDYGAKGDGVANDTSAIQAALNDAVKGKGTVVLFPFGTYRVTAALTITGGNRIFVEGDGSVIQGGREDLFRVQDTSNFQVSRLTYDTPTTQGVARFFQGDSNHECYPV